jgi:hypothetical protein
VREKPRTNSATASSGVRAADGRIEGPRKSTSIWERERQRKRRRCRAYDRDSDVTRAVS